MAKPPIPTKSRFRNGTASNNDHRVKQDREEMLYKYLAEQQRIIDYNTNKINNVSKRGLDLKNEFKKVQLTGNSFVVQCYVEDLFKHVGLNKDGKMVSMFINQSQLDAREKYSDPAKWVVNPIPIINKGILMAISPDLVLMYQKTKKELTAYDKEAGEKMVIPKVGDTVYLNHFMSKDTRFYLDKQARMNDSVKSQTEYHLHEFDMMFLLDSYAIESIVPKEFAEELPDAPSKYLYNEFFSKITHENFRDYVHFEEQEQVVE